MATPLLMLRVRGRNSAQHGERVPMGLHLSIGVYNRPIAPYMGSPRSVQRCAWGVQSCLGHMRARLLANISLQFARAARRCLVCGGVQSCVGHMVKLATQAGTENQASAIDVIELRPHRASLVRCAGSRRHADTSSATPA